MELSYSEKQFEAGEHLCVELLAAKCAGILVGDTDEYVLHHLLVCDKCSGSYRHILPEKFDLSSIKIAMEKEGRLLEYEFREAIVRRRIFLEIRDLGFPFGR